MMTPSSGAGRRLGRPQQHLDVAQRELVLADHREQVVGRLEAQLRRQVVQLDAVLPSRCSSFSTASRPRATVSCVICSLNQARTLARGAMAGQEAQVGVEPVARRPAFLRRR